MIAHEVYFISRNRPVPAAAPRAFPLQLLLLVVLLAWSGSFGLEGQTADTPGGTNNLAPAEEAATLDTAQAAEVGRDEDTSGTNAVAETNQIASPGPDARERRLQRQRRPRSASTQANGNRPADPTSTNAASSVLDYAAFRLVAERNIFDPNRSPRSSIAPVRPKTVDSFTFVGTMSYEKGIFAFFDGSSSDYRKALKPDDTIAGYKVIAISPETVKLMLKTNVLELAVGTQMRRREDGVWERSQEAPSYANTTSTAAATEPAASGAESDIIKKMMQRREKE